MTLISGSSIVWNNAWLGADLPTTPGNWPPYAGLTTLTLTGSYAPNRSTAGINNLVLTGDSAVDEAFELTADSFFSVASGVTTSAGNFVFRSVFQYDTSPGVKMIFQQDTAAGDYIWLWQNNGIVFARISDVTAGTAADIATFSFDPSTVGYGDGSWLLVDLAAIGTTRHCGIVGQLFTQTASTTWSGASSAGIRIGRRDPGETQTRGALFVGQALGSNTSWWSPARHVSDAGAALWTPLTPANITPSDIPRNTFTIDFVGGSVGIDGRARTDGVVDREVTVTATTAGQTYLVRFANTTDPTPPTIVQSAANPAVWRFTPSNGAQTYVIELITDFGLSTETRSRRVYAIREPNSGLRYPAPMERADPSTALYNAGADVVAASDDNEAGSPFGWDPDMRGWLIALNGFYRELPVPPGVQASDGWLLTHSSNRYLALDTRLGSERLTFGNASTNPQYTFAGTGNVSAGGYVSANHLILPERATDPGTTADQGAVYTKDVAGNEELFFQDGARVVQITSGGGLSTVASGETNTASNLGAGTGVFGSKSGVDLRFRSLVGGTGITLSNDASEITIDRDAISLNDLSDVVAATPAQGEVLYFNGTNWVPLGVGTSGQFLQTQGTAANPIWANAPAPALSSAANIGSGEGVFSSISSGTAQFKSLIAGSNITISSSATEITIAAAAAGEVNTASNLGAGAALFTAKSGVNLPFRSIVGGSGITATQNTNDVTLTASVALDDLTDTTVTGAAQGAVLYRNASGWVHLPAGTSGQYLSTAGASANPVWATLPSFVAAGASLGAGEVVYAGASGSTLQFKSVVAGTNISLSSTGTELTISASVPAAGEVNTASNVGSGAGLFTTKSGVNLPFRSLIGGTGITLSSSATEVTIARDAIALNELTDVDVTGAAQGAVLYRNATEWVPLAPGTTGQVLQTAGAAANPVWATLPAVGETNTASNVGSGTGLFTTKSGVDLPFRSLVGGTGITLSSSATEVTIARDAIALNDLSNVTTAGESQGAILYRNSTAWSILAPGTAGQILQTQGAGSDPTWTSVTATVTLQQAYNAGNTITLAAATPVAITAASAASDALDIVTGRLSLPNVMLLGNAASGTGANSVIIGDTAAGATATGAIAIGQAASVSQTDGVAIGRAALASGLQAVAIGVNTEAEGANTIAIGNSAGDNVGFGNMGAGGTAIGLNAWATSDAVAISTNAAARGPFSLAIGEGTLTGTTSAGGVALGHDAAVSSLQGVAIGRESAASNTSAVSIGYQNTASGATSISLGVVASASALQSIAIGNTAAAAGARGIGLGAASAASGASAIALGHQATASQPSSVALGQGATVAHQYALAFGDGATTSAANQVVFGASGSNQQITDFVIGNGVSAAVPTPPTIRTTSGLGTNIAGGDLRIEGGRSTGTAAGGSVVLRTTPASLASSAAVNTPVDRLTVSSTGAVGFSGNFGSTGSYLVSLGASTAPVWRDFAYGGLDMRANAIVTPITVTGTFVTIVNWSSKLGDTGVTTDVSLGTAEADVGGIYEIHFSACASVDATATFQFLGSTAGVIGTQQVVIPAALTSISMSTFAVLSAGETVRVQVANNTNLLDVLVQDATFWMRRMD